MGYVSGKRIRAERSAYCCKVVLWAGALTFSCCTSFTLDGRCRVRSMSLSGTDSVDAADPNTSTLPSRNLSLQKQRTKKGPGMDHKKSRGYR